MKKIQILLTIIFYCGFNSIKAQSYQTIFGSNNTSWVFSWDNMDNFSYNKVLIQSDTIINATTYKYVTLLYPDIYKYLLREDTLAGKVWCKQIQGSSSFDTAEYIVFDYSLEVGDSFDLGAFFANTPTLVLFSHVDSVRYVDGRKCIYFNLMINANDEDEAPIPSVPQEPFTMIEGIGGNVPPIWRHEDGSLMMNKYLSCSYKNDTQTSYINRRYAGYCPDLEVGIHEVDEIKKIKIYPNPTSQILRIQYDNSIHIQSVQLTDISGKEIKSYYSHFDAINIQGIVSGMYFLRVFAKEGTETQKVIIK